MSWMLLGSVGEILGNANSTFDWKIQNFAVKCGQMLGKYKSSPFMFGGTTWNMFILSNSYSTPTTGWVGIGVSEQFSYQSKCTNIVSFNCRLSIKDKDNRDYMFRILPKPELSIANRLYFFWDEVTISDLLDVMGNIAPDGILTISCTLSCKSNDTKETQETVATKSGEELKAKAEDIRYVLSNPKGVEELTAEEDDVSDVLSNPKGVEELKAEADDVRDVFSNPEGVEELTAEEDDVSDVLSNPTGVDRVLHNLKQLLLSEEFSDVTLKVKDREFKAHRQILVSQSSVFHSMFKHDTVEKSSGIVDIPDCDPDAFKPFLHYLYSGRLEEMSTSNVCDLYSIADKYDTEDLKAECVAFMMKELSVATLCDFIALALLYNEPTLLEACTEFFSKNTKTIIVTADWQLFVKENPVAANELFIKAFERSTN